MMTMNRRGARVRKSKRDGMRELTRASQPEKRAAMIQAMILNEGSETNQAIDTLVDEFIKLKDASGL